MTITSRWKQFFTPIQSLSAKQGKDLMAHTPLDELIILDVRQPAEYRKGHIPGARLIPLPQLNNRFQELDRDKTILAY
jgi:rhodanese-related sulfurtransferase